MRTQDADSKAQKNAGDNEKPDFPPVRFLILPAFQLSIRHRLPVTTPDAFSKSGLRRGIFQRIVEPCSMMFVGG